MITWSRRLMPSSFVALLILVVISMSFLYGSTLSSGRFVTMMIPEAFVSRLLRRIVLRSMMYES